MRGYLVFSGRYAEVLFRIAFSVYFGRFIVIRGGGYTLGRSCY